MDERQLILLGFGTFTVVTASVYYFISGNNTTKSCEKTIEPGIIQKYLSKINVFSRETNKSDVKKPHHL